MPDIRIIPRGGGFPISATVIQVLKALIQNELESGRTPEQAGEELLYLMSVAMEEVEAEMEL